MTDKILAANFNMRVDTFVNALTAAGGLIQDYSGGVEKLISLPG